MNIEAIRQLIVDLRNAGLSAAELEKPGFKLTIKRGRAQPHAITTSLPAPEPASDELTIKACGPGRFLNAHPDDARVLAPLGSEIAIGQRVALLAVGTLLLPVYSPHAGTVSSILAAIDSNVGYGQPLLRLSPSSAGVA